MKIVIEARALGMKGGVNTYVQQLISHLAPRHGHEITLLVNQSHDASLTYGLPQEVVPMLHPALLSWWMDQSVPKRLSRLQPTLVHYTKAHVPKHKKFPTVVTIHDVIPLFLPQTQALMARMFWPKALRQAVEMSDHIITISARSKQDIMDYLGVESARITVIPEAVDTMFFGKATEISKAEAAASLGLSTPYILFVGTRDMRKNIGALIRSFEKIAGDIPHSLVIAGKQALRHDASQAQAAASPFAKRIHFLDFVPLAQLPALYRGADVFVWPSIYEGWGLPPLEAMAAGVPVIVSDGGSLPEVVGKSAEVVRFSSGSIAGRLHDDVFEEDLADRIRLVVSDSNRQQELRVAGFEQLKSFSWNTMAEATWGVYEGVLSRIY